MSDIRDAFPSKYLKASDLKGAQVTVTMDHVDHEPVGQNKEMKAVLYFEGKEKGLVLNKTNANKIMEITGSPVTEEWQGQRIRLYPTETNFGGETVDCIRIRPANGQATRMAAPPPVAAPLTDDDIPF
jgi:hypothetical protein